MSVVVTGCAGFIGYHLTEQLLALGQEVVGIDNLNSYYDINIKHARLNQLSSHKSFTFHQLNIAHHQDLRDVIKQDVTVIIHLAAQAGVRYSLEQPFSYIDSNVQGTLSLLECAKDLSGLKQLIMASSSSVYGKNNKLPFSIDQKIDSPASLYAATKIAKEAMAYSYSDLYNIPTTILRFFTVYGPWGRPDMAIYKFSQAIVGNQPIELYNNGEMHRDFTYIDDIVHGIMACVEKTQTFADLSTPYRTYNLGNNQMVGLRYFISLLEQAFDKKAIIKEMAMQKGEIKATIADISLSQQQLGYNPANSIEQGIPKFVDWFKKYYNI